MSERTNCFPVTRLGGQVLGILLPLAAAALVLGAPAQAHEGRYADRIEGTWDSTVTPAACAGGPPVVAPGFRATNLFAPGGALIATSVPVPPPSLGRWDRTGARRYVATFRFIRANGPQLLGFTHVTRRIELAPDANSFTSQVTIQLYDPDDNAVGTSCATETARRVF